MARAVTILGMGASAAGNVETIGEVWSLNDAYQCFSVNGGLPKFDMFFELHDLAYARTFKSKANPAHDHFTRIDMLGCPVMMREIVPEIKGSIRFPVERVLSFLGSEFLRGSPSYMLAYALFMGFTHIRVFGVDQMDEGHKYQRESWAHIVGIGIGRGVEFSGVYKFMDAPELDAGLDGWINEIKNKKEKTNG